MEESRIKVFISYSWDSDKHKEWVHKLYDDLICAGFDVIFDQNDLRLGDPFTPFMEKSITESDFVLIVLTPNYKIKADQRLGGVGYEDSIITSEVNEMRNHRKFIPVLAEGTWKTSSPVWSKGKLGVDLSTPDKYDSEFKKLVDAMKHEQAALCRADKNTSDEEMILTARDFFEMGSQKELRKDFIGAIIDYTKSIEMEPSFAITYVNRANMYFYYMKDYRMAMSDYDKAITLDPSFQKAYYNRAVAHYHLGEFQEAVNDCDKSIELDPSDIMAFQARGIAYCGLKKYKKAISDFSQVISIYPKESDAYYSRSIAYELNGDRAKALKDRITFDRLTNKAQKSSQNNGMRFSPPKGINN